MATFDSEAIFINSRSTNIAKVEAIDLIIDGLLTAATSATGNEGTSEYSLNDGQTQIKKVYRSASDIYTAISNFERLRQVYMNRINGRVVRLMDSKNFPGTC